MGTSNPIHVLSNKRSFIKRGSKKRWKPRERDKACSRKSEAKLPFTINMANCDMPITLDKVSNGSE